MTITLVSAIIAIAVGGIEALGLMAGPLNQHGTFWELVKKFNGNFGTLGYFIIGLFALSWIASVSIYKWRRYDELEANGYISVALTFSTSTKFQDIP
jgi:nickel/cobalt transporter (NiCoT) family protein